MKSVDISSVSSGPVWTAVCVPRGVDPTLHAQHIEVAQGENFLLASIEGGRSKIKFSASSVLSDGAFEFGPDSSVQIELPLSVRGALLTPQSIAGTHYVPGFDASEVRNVLGGRRGEMCWSELPTEDSLRDAQREFLARPDSRLNFYRPGSLAEGRAMLTELDARLHVEKFSACGIPGMLSEARSVMEQYHAISANTEFALLVRLLEAPTNLYAYFKRYLHREGLVLLRNLGSGTECVDKGDIAEQGDRSKRELAIGSELLGRFLGPEKRACAPEEWALRLGEALQRQLYPELLKAGATVRQVPDECVLFARGKWIHSSPILSNERRLQLRVGAAVRVD